MEKVGDVRSVTVFERTKQCLDVDTPSWGRFKAVCSSVLGGRQDRYVMKMKMKVSLGAKASDIEERKKERRVVRKREGGRRGRNGVGSHECIVPLEF